jgi:hypothetical protein
MTPIKSELVFLSGGSQFSAYNQMASRKTFKQLYGSNPSEAEIRDWIDTATLQELKEFVRFWSKNTVCGDYGRTALSIKLAEDALKPHWVIWATFVAGAIAAIAAVILLFR